MVALALALQCNSEGLGLPRAFHNTGELRGRIPCHLRGKLFRYKFTMLNKTRMNPLNLMHEITIHFLYMVHVLYSPCLKQYCISMEKGIPEIPPAHLIRSCSLRYFFSVSQSVIFSRMCHETTEENRAKKEKKKTEWSGAKVVTVIMHACLPRRPCDYVVF